MGSDAQTYQSTFCGEGYSMNSSTPAANGRAGAGFQDSKAGAGIIFRAALSRSHLLLLAPLLILTCWNAHPAQANGVNATIANGQTVVGTVTDSGSDSYTFKNPAGGSFFASVGETGFHDPSFVPMIDLTGPGTVSGFGQPLYANVHEINAAAGNWTVKVSRSEEGGYSGGTYVLTLVQVPVAGGNVGSTMSPGVSTSGSISRGSVDVRTLKGVAGQTVTLTLDATSENGFDPDVTVFTPTGGLATEFGCVASCSDDVSLKADGVYTVLVSKYDRNDVTGTYTLSVK
jgi:hypothetical protein